MSRRFPSVSPRATARVLERCGWEPDRTKGSHRIFRHPEHRHRIVVPMHARDLARGTLLQILDASGVSREDFVRLL